MARVRHLSQFLSTFVFVGSGLAVALMPRHSPVLASLRDPDGSMLVLTPAVRDSSQAIGLAQLYLRPENPVVWMLLVVLWALLSIDALARVATANRIDRLRHFRDPRTMSPAGRWLSLALLAGAAWPWMVGLSLVPTAIGATAMLAASVTAALHSRSSPRPAIGFLAGWCSAVCWAALAALMAQWWNLGLPVATILAILPAAIMGLIVHARIGHSVSYPVAMIWAFCGLAVTTMGSNSMIALAAIIGISTMAIALIRAAS